MRWIFFVTFAYLTVVTSVLLPGHQQIAPLLTLQEEARPIAGSYLVLFEAHVAVERSSHVLVSTQYESLR